MKRLLTALTLLALCLPLFVNAQTPDLLDVTFTPNPLFSASDTVMPGDSKTPTFTVENKTGSPQELYVQFVETSESGNLANVIDIKIVGGDTDVERSLDEWFDLGPVKIDSALGVTKKEFSVSSIFAPGAGDEYQSGTVNFDFCVGFSGGDLICSGSADTNTDTDPDTPTSGGGQFWRFGGGTTLTGDPIDGDETPFFPTPTGEPIPPSSLGGVGTGATTTGESTPVANEDGTTETEDEDQDVNHTTDDGTGVDQAAAAFLGLPDNLADGLRCAGYFLIALILIWLLTLTFETLRKASRMSKRPRILSRIAFVSSLFLVATVIAAIVPFECTILPLYISTWISVAVYFFNRKRLS